MSESWIFVSGIGCALFIIYGWQILYVYGWQRLREMAGHRSMLEPPEVPIMNFLAAGIGFLLWVVGTYLGVAP